MGLMGEAGPEAIMPLKRGADGSLGVSAEGSGTVINNFHINAVDAKSFADLVARNPGAIVAAVAGNYGDNGAMRKIIKGS
jgi:phage-related minor tail protein